MKVGVLGLTLSGLCSAEPALAASDQVLRAFYCATVVDDTIMRLQQANADAARETSEPSRSAILEGSARLLQQLTANRDRLKAYAVTHITLNNPSEASQIAGAKQRGEVDSRQCSADSSMSTCARTLPCLDPTWLSY
jgi:hypothetical protein